MPRDLFAELNAVAISAPVQNGSLVFRNGDPGSAVYVVRSGRIALIWCHSGQIYPMDTLGPDGSSACQQFLMASSARLRRRLRIQCSDSSRQTKCSGCWNAIRV
jgi:hypothetical protein